jgi:hypothetical protein
VIGWPYTAVVADRPTVKVAVAAGLMVKLARAWPLL